MPGPTPTGGIFGGTDGGVTGGNPGDGGITLSPIGNCGEKLIPGWTTCENGIPLAIDWAYSIADSGNCGV
jgi:hypothetical protein